MFEMRRLADLVCSVDCDEMEQSGRSDGRQCEELRPMRQLDNLESQGSRLFGSGVKTGVLSQPAGSASVASGRTRVLAAV